MSSSNTSESDSVSSSPSRSTFPPHIESRKRKREKEDDEPDAASSPESTKDEEDIPVLSHAEQRRQKKRAKLEAKAVKVSSKKAARQKPSQKEDAAGNNRTRQNSVWVGNLSFKTTVADLQEFFNGVGEITRVNLPTKTGTVANKVENRGFAYVDFTTPDAKTVAIALSEKPLHGRRLLIKDGDDFSGRPAAVTSATDSVNPEAQSATAGLSKMAKKILASQKQPPAPTLFLGNLGFETTEEAIKELFVAHRDKGKRKITVADGSEKDGNVASTDTVPAETDAKPGGNDYIRKVRMGTFEDSGLCKGFAFVDFTTKEHATAALINPRNHRLNGRDLVVEYASADAVRRGGGPRSQTNEGGKGYKPSKRPKPFLRKGPGTAYAAQQNAERKRQEREEARALRGEEDAPRAQQGDAGDSKVPKGREWKSSRARSKPGAALALAKRESAAIIPAQGKKIVF